ncbi:MAG: hypothetical protein ACU0E9_07530 [Limimaricola soesokkakensis]|uniref:hypothetical protein n=1 Tax=Limimaricola soesokkakensis TaxID=1343159 RepID=UPI004059022B
MRLWPALLAALTAGPAQAVELHFCWRGASGYSMTGMMRFPDALLQVARVTESDLTHFEITGWQDGVQIGGWSLDALRPETTWLLSFDPRAMRFPMPGIGVFQAWNADGGVANCGDPGFGFNAGNAGQDVCVDNRFVSESTIPWWTPLTASSAPVSPDCDAPMVLSLRHGEKTSP